MTREQAAETVRGLLDVIDVAMPRDLQAQDKRVRAGVELAALLEGMDGKTALDYLEDLLPEHMKATVRLADPAEAARSFSRPPNAGKR